MAISTQRSLAQLKDEANKLGLLVTQTGKREGKTDYVLALRNYYLSEEYPDGVPQALDLMLQMESPMLCAQSKHLPEIEMNHIWTSKDWIAEEKIDGCRFVSYWGPTREECNGFSRNISVKDFLPVSYKDNVYMPNVDYSKITDRFLIDSEIICTNPQISTIMGSKGVVTECQLQAVTALLAMEPSKSIEIQKNERAPLQLKVFDCLWWNGEWLTDKPYYERVQYMLKAYAELKNAGVNCERPISTYSNKQEFYKAILRRGGEGVVLKNVYSQYVASSNRSKTGFLKVKRTLSQALDLETGMGDSIDGWISGYELATEGKGFEGLIGSIDVTVTVKRSDGTSYDHVIARVPNIDLETRKKMTSYNSDGEPILNPSFYGKVVEVDGQSISAREHRLQHPVLVRWRPDKTQFECVLSESLILDNIL
jgi:ATP-dependent DNA ligase